MTRPPGRPRDLGKGLAILDAGWMLFLEHGVEATSIAAIAAKAEKETAYHLRHSAEWMIRLGDGTAESARRAQAAVDALWAYTGEMFTPPDALLMADGIAVDPETLRPAYDATVASVLGQATLARPAGTWMHKGGRQGRHTEHLGLLLAEMQHLQRTYPGATW